MLRAALLAAGVAAAGGLQPFSPWLQRGYCSAAAASSSDSSAASSPTAGPEQMLNLHRIAGDGRCLFRSLAQGAHLAAQVDAAAAAGGDAHPLLLLQPAQETAAADELRAAICRELLRRRSEGLEGVGAGVGAVRVGGSAAGGWAPPNLQGGAVLLHRRRL